MSANNYIKIFKDSKKYQVSELDADTGGLISNLGAHDTLEDAIRTANTYMETEEVEYGYTIDLPPKPKE